MSLTGLDGALLAGAVFGLAAAMVLPGARGAVPGGSRGRCATRVPRALAALASVLAAAAGVRALAGAELPPLAWWPGFPGRAVHARARRALGARSCCCSARSAPSRSRPTRRSARSAARRRGSRCTPAFALSMFAAFTARHVLLFLVAWEAMTLLSAALVAHDTKQLARARRGVRLPCDLARGRGVHRARAVHAVGAGRLVPVRRARRRVPATARRRGRAARVVVHRRLLGQARPAARCTSGCRWRTPRRPRRCRRCCRASWSRQGSTACCASRGRCRARRPRTGARCWSWPGIASMIAGALYAAVEPDAKRLLAYSTLKNAGVLALARRAGRAARRGNGQPRHRGRRARGRALPRGRPRARQGRWRSSRSAKPCTRRGSRHLEPAGRPRAPHAAHRRSAALVATLALCGLPRAARASPASGSCSRR